MKTLSKFFSIAAPSLAVGGLLFYSSFGHADDRAEREPPTPPSPPARKAPRAHWAPPPGINGIGGLVNVDAIRALVRDSLREARKSISTMQAPAEVRAKVLARFDKINAIVEKRLAKLDLSNLADLEAQLEGLGQEIESVMQGFEGEIGQLLEHSDLGNKLKMLQALGRLNVDVDIDGPDDVGDADDVDDSDADDPWDFSTAPMPPKVAPVPPAPPVPPVPPVPGSVANVPSYDVPDGVMASDLELRADQVAKLRAVRTETDGRIRPAREQLDKLSAQLEAALRDPATSQDQVNGLVDRISALEATIRKARIGAWLRSRALLDAQQRSRIGSP